MRPVTAPCDHDPPSRFPVGTRSPRLDPPDKASDRPLMRPVTVALSPRPALKPPSVPIAMTARPFQGREERSGRRVIVAKRPERAPRQGREGKEPHQRRVRAPCASCERSHRASTFSHQQRRTRCEAWCEERARAAAGAGATRQARGVFVSTGNSGKQGGDVSGAGDQPVETNMTEASAATTVQQIYRL